MNGTISIVGEPAQPIEVLATPLIYGKYFQFNYLETDSKFKVRKLSTYVVQFLQKYQQVSVRSSKNSVSLKDPTRMLKYFRRYKTFMFY